MTVVQLTNLSYRHRVSLNGDPGTVQAHIQQQFYHNYLYSTLLDDMYKKQNL